MKRAKFQVYQDTVLDWRWRLIAANGRIIADSGEGYSTRAGAIKATWRLSKTILFAGRLLDVTE